MKTLLIVFHSVTGGAEQMAAAAAQAATPFAVQVRLLLATEARPEDVLAADALLFVCPEMLAAMSGLMKDFFDRCYYPVLDRITGRPYACLVCAGTDGQGAVRQIERIATGWRLRRVAAAHIVCTHASTPERILAAKTLAARDLAHCAEAGATLAAGLEQGIF